jgi:hypothetical protein
MRFVGKQRRPVRAARAPRGEDGMSTAEYAIGTVAACGFAAVLLKLLTSSEVADLLRAVVRHAFSFAS